MEFYNIVEDDSVFPGEYILHEPTQSIVICGSFCRIRNRIRVLKDGRLVEDKIDQFKKINMPQAEQRSTGFSRCKGCGGA
jgi:hypothetical protein